MILEHAATLGARLLWENNAESSRNPYSHCKSYLFATLKGARIEAILTLLFIIIGVRTA